MHLSLYGRPETEPLERAWRSLPLQLHDAGLVDAAIWRPLPTMYMDLSDKMIHILQSHPGPVRCLRMDSSEFPSVPERLARLIDAASKSNVEELMMMNLTGPADVEFPLHRLRGDRLRSLCLGFVSVMQGMKDALAAAGVEGYAWCTIAELRLVSCRFDESAMSRIVADLLGLRKLQMCWCHFSKPLTLESRSLICIELSNCSAAVSGGVVFAIGRAPLLTSLTTGVIPVASPVVGDAAVPAPVIRIVIYFCEAMNNFDYVSLQEHCLELWSSSSVRIQRRTHVTLSCLHTFGVRVNLSRGADTTILRSLLCWMPNLISLRISSVVAADNEEEQRHFTFTGVPCVVQGLQESCMLIECCLYDPLCNV
ncbi:hypothetical protein BS78_01G444200 [Paspalum vaginatum]|nr:hypothetical protein BS78_01G444200 [Paspalum vaginatum]